GRRVLLGCELVRGRSGGQVARPRLGHGPRAPAVVRAAGRARDGRGRRASGTAMAGWSRLVAHRPPQPGFGTTTLRAGPHRRPTVGLGSAGGADPLTALDRAGSGDHAVRRAVDESRSD